MPNRNHLEHDEIPKFLTTDAAAKILGRSATAMRVMRCQGKGPRYYRHGGSTIRYKLADILEWAEREPVDPEDTHRESPKSG